MRISNRAFLGAVAISFLFGMGYGFWSEFQSRKLASSDPFRIICAEGWLDESTLEAFAQRNHLEVQYYTYHDLKELMRLLANANGSFDLLCVSSFVVGDLVNSGWLKSLPFDQEVGNLKLISADFQHLPFDPNDQYTVPYFWSLYGLLGKGGDLDRESRLSWKQLYQSARLGIWDSPAVVLMVLSKVGLEIDRRLELQETERLDKELRNLLGRIDILHEVSGVKDQISLVPLGQAAALLSGNKGAFRLLKDGSPLEVGSLAIGSKSTKVGAAQRLIDDLLETKVAEKAILRLKVGSVHSSMEATDGLASMQKASALREFPLDRISFPEYMLEALVAVQRSLPSPLNRK